MADTPDLGSGEEIRTSSNLVTGTKLGPKGKNHQTNLVGKGEM